MKSLLSILIVAGLFFASCNKDTSLLLDETKDVAEPKMHFVSMTPDGPSYGEISIADFPNRISTETSLTVDKKKVNLAIGDFTAEGGFVESEFNAISNPGGIHGYYSFSFNGSMLSGPVNCLYVDGNTATVGFIVDNNELTPIVPIGSYMYAHVIDNGEGYNSPPDIHKRGWWFIPNLGPDIGCDWPFDWYFNDFIVETGNIQVK